jgi:hypothetical protein
MVGIQPLEEDTDNPCEVRVVISQDGHQSFVRGLVKQVEVAFFIITIIGVAWFFPGSKLPSLFNSIAPKPSPQQTVQAVPQQPIIAVSRVDQTSPNAYTTTQEYNEWWHSSCSAAAMTYALNAAGGHYHLQDTLTAEINAQQISSDLGLLNGFTSVSKTVGSLGYHATSVQGGIDGIVRVANSGSPVVISMRNADWPNGHILVVTGGDGSHIRVVDSWSTNRTSFSRATFAAQYTGLAAVIKSDHPVSNHASGSSVVGAPSISAEKINSILCNAGSPACGAGQTFYDDGVKYGIDPVYALAFFKHESSFGTQGAATRTLSIGNINCSSGYSCIGRFRAYPTWNGGIHDWFKLISEVYIGQFHASTVEQVIPHYAPSSDNNDEAAYIASVEADANSWRK